MNTESINLTENPSGFVEPYFTKKSELLVIVPYSVNFVKKTLDFVKMILKSINFMKTPLNFSISQGDGPRQLRKYWPSDRDPTVRIDRDVNFAKKPRTLLK